MRINVPTKYLFCIYSPKKDDYMLASFPTLKLAEYELSRLKTDEFFSDALVNGPIVADVSDHTVDNSASFIIDQKFSHFYTLSEMVDILKESDFDEGNRI